MITHFKFCAVLLFVSTLLSSCKEDEVTPELENKLVAIAGSDVAVNRYEPVTLDASASKDGNKRPFTILWSVKTKPQGSNASIANADTVKTIFIPDVAGRYVVKLTIAQGSWSAVDEVAITVADPQSEDPETVILNEDFTENTTLADIFDDPSGIDYLVTENINVHAELVIMPGVVMAFAEDKGLQIVNGFISARGTMNNRITFKGSDNGASFWKGILIHSNSELNEFEHVSIEQGGSSAFSESGVKANLAIAGTTFSGGAVKVSETSFLSSGGYGFYLQGMSLLNRFSSNSFVDNELDVYIAASQLHKVEVDNLTVDSGLLEIETGGSVIGEEPTTWKNIDNGHYLVTSPISIFSGVTIEPGASLHMRAGITISMTGNGYLKAIGSSEARIAFTSTEGTTYWSGLYFNSYNENNKLAFCDVSHAGLNNIDGSEHAGNIVLGPSGTVRIENTVIKNGLGYGVVLKTVSQVNGNVATINTFTDLQKGVMFPEAVESPEHPPLTGLWLDQWSFQQNFSDIQNNYYNDVTHEWFGGAANPWSTETGKGMGIRFSDDMTFTWLIAEHSPVTGCESYSAEYITGTTALSGDQITFNQDYWRSKFINSCDPTQNVDMDVTPSPIVLRYEIAQKSNLWTGELFWELKFSNPDGSSFSYYRR